MDLINTSRVDLMKYQTLDNRSAVANLLNKGKESPEESRKRTLVRKLLGLKGNSIKQYK